MRIHELTSFWDDAIGAFLDGRPTSDGRLDNWMRAYKGRGRGEVDHEALPEPFLGPLAGTAGVFLALNPGQSHHEFQGRNGLFADEIRRLGSYTAWAATWPYFRPSWTNVMGRNRHHASRLKFLQTWLGSEEIREDSMTSFELYPWHSKAVTARMAPDPNVIQEFVWDPIADLGNVPIFAFGAPWFDVIDALGLEVVDRLGDGGRDFGSPVDSRSALVARTSGGNLVVAIKQLGYAGPPAAADTHRLKAAVAA